MARHPAFFLDRDGTLIEDIGYIKQSSEVCLYPFACETRSLLQEHFLLFIIGDLPSDIQCGSNAGITPIYLLTGHGRKHQDEINKETVICSDLLKSSKHIFLKNNQI